MNIRYLWAISLGLINPFSPVLPLATASESPAPPPLIALNEDEQERITLYEYVIPAVVTLEIDTDQGTIGIGSGSIIDETGLILTNEHVTRLSENNQVKIKTTWGNRYDAKVIAEDSERDLALVQVFHYQFPILSLSDMNYPRIGQTFYAVGSPSIIDIHEK